MKEVICGIDYGSKLAGTTVLAWNNENQIHYEQSVRKKDADAWLEGKLTDLQPVLIAMDAPLSLPGALIGKGSNYFYRQCDAELKAMSPMFLGGLTARAIKMKDLLRKQDLTVIETYPKWQALRIFPSDSKYKIGKGPTTEMVHELEKSSQMTLVGQIPNWHVFDAVLAWIGALRYYNGIAISHGNPEEGMIYY